MLKEIGSNFWISPEDKQFNSQVTVFSPLNLGFIGSDYALLSTGRSATALVIKDIEQKHQDIKKTVCLPSFTCDTVYEPFLKAGYKVVTLPIRKNLSCDKQYMLSIIRDADPGIVLFHRYFGFNTIDGVEYIVDELRNEGIVTIEDCTQSMYSGFKPLNSDYTVGSIRKWCGVPDGGFAICLEGKFKDKPQHHDSKLEAIKCEAADLKYAYMVDNQGEKEKFLQKYREAEEILDSQSKFYTIAPTSMAVQSNLDIESMKAARRQNYELLLKGLKGVEGIEPIFPELKDDVVPLYFPMYCRDRASLQKLLVANSIYAPVIWPKGDNCPDICVEAGYAYGHALCIPIDQRYSKDDMQRIIKVIRDSSLWTGWMTWDEILPYKEQIIDWEMEVTIKYHYPDRTIPREFFEGKVNALESYLKSGNTFFWGATSNGELLGYYWGYIADFLFEKTWYERSSYMSENSRGLGLGMKAKLAALDMAKEKGCVKSESMYAPFNEAQAHIYDKLGFHVSRIEVVKKI